MAALNCSGWAEKVEWNHLGWRNSKAVGCTIHRNVSQKDKKKTTGVEFSLKYSV